ncbi:MAG: hypothetical protein DVB28_000571 [Verrucomicrobia bacterium]|nr:MAG: hypothetical protein DVB28_000571 [Verrucomicrobiota bacterium]
MPSVEPLKSMRRLFFALFISFMATSALKAAPVPEVIIISGGVSLSHWEKYKTQPHDKWWMNFVRAARIRIQQVRETDPQAQITWLVYKPAYVRRAKEERKDLIVLIDSVRDAYRVKRIYFSKTSELLDYLNKGKNRGEVKIADLEYFGHSNKACWMFDYSNAIDSCSKVWLHENDLTKLRPGMFTKDAYVRSWGCHTGESMSAHFLRATGVPMWGAEGKTQYRTDELPALAERSGRWKK